MQVRSGLNGLASNQMKRYKVYFKSLSVEVVVEEKGSV